MLLRPLTYHAPLTIQEAAHLQSSLPDVRILAGGTFLLNSLKLLKRKGSKTPSHVISLKKIQALKGIETTDQQLIIRAMTIVNDLYESKQLTESTEILRTVCKNISTQPIRNMATIGGNLTCRYTWTEMGAVMIALNAQMHFMDQNGNEDILPAETFFKNNAKTDKIFTHVSIPLVKTALNSYQRVKKTMNVDVPLLTVCIQTNIKDRRWTDTRVGINNGTSFAQRDPLLETFLNGQQSSLDLAAQALNHLTSEIYDKRSDYYKKHMFRVSIKNAIIDIHQKSTG